jgi:hypothetical protein
MCFLAAGEKVYLGMQSARRMFLYPQAVPNVFEAANNMEKRQNVNSFLKIPIHDYEMMRDMFQSRDDFIASQGAAMIFLQAKKPTACIIPVSRVFIHESRKLLPAKEKERPAHRAAQE